MNKVLDKNKCCGCHACLNICPKKAISMSEDEKGFKYPNIDSDKCINCGLCKKVCPVLNNQEKQKQLDVYACYNTNLDERINSSSGGVFILLAKKIIEKNGVVFGAIFNERFEVEHGYCETQEDLIKIMGSKYVQSTIGTTYEKVKKLLDEDRYVLFTGTPCQIEGLKSYLRKDYTKLYTQDIICHGVPSPKLWKKYLEYQEKKNNEKIQKISFRNKDKGWSLFRMKVFFNTKNYSEEASKDLFSKAFLNNICLRDSCYDCSFKKKYRNSDITLADFWGVDKCYPEMYDDIGTSLVIINSNKGRNLFDEIKINLKYKEVDLEKALKYNIAMIKSAKHCANEKEFAMHINDMSMEKLINKYIPKPPIIRRLKNLIKRSLIKAKKHHKK